MAAVPVEPKVSPFIQYWRKAGGGSLTVSIALHAVLLIAAYFIVETIALPEKAVDFVPGGGSKSGDEASLAQNVQIQQKKSRVLQQSLPMKRITVEGAAGTVALPDLPLDSTDLPTLSNSSLGGGSMGSGGFGTAGAGMGSGTGIGSGALKGFAGMTFFGKLGGDGIPGRLYDMKQDRDRNPLPYQGNQGEIFKLFASNINKAASKRFAPSALQDYYQAQQQLNYTYLLVPADTKATEGPKNFNAEKEVQPSGWFVHYSGMVSAPQNGEYRFVGFFDDLLVVYINGKPVLDGSWVPMVAQGERRPDEDIRQEFKGPGISGNRTAYFGKWVRFSGPTRIDIVVGETPGGLVGGLLMIEKKGGDYERRADGTPILPLFSTVQPDMQDYKRIHEDPFGKNIQIAKETPVFKLHRSGLEGGASGLDALRMGGR